MFLAIEINVAFPPSSTSIPPQVHHQKTTICTPFFAKTPAKTPVHHTRKN
jgi:hypothetical protein